ncbi:MAG: OmpA family protein [Bacteroidetes bacterium]|nr:OmpA family protein [Bacteroidota bacterium]
MAEASSAKRKGDGAVDQAPPDTAGSEGAGSSELINAELEELRRLLLGGEQDRIEVLEQREVHVEDVSRVLPEAIALRAGQDDQLARALEPTIKETLRASIQRDPQPFADVLFPIFGPAIRKSIREALRSMLETINRTIEQRLSPQGIQWRIEAWRTGLPFSQVVMRHTLHYRVEQVFLIDEETGLPLQHVVAEAVDAQDSSLVSSMLTALEDFAHDSFDAEEEATLDTLEIGDLTVWIEQGSQAYLAIAIRGLPPPDLRAVMEDTLDTIHFQFKAELEAFEGDAESLDGTRPLLESALLGQHEERKRKTSPLLWILLAVGIVALGAWIFLTVRERIRWNDYLARLDAEPGLVVTESGRSGGDWYVRGLRDPLAQDPVALLAETPFSPGEVRGEWAFYQTLDSAFVLQRAAQLLEPPPTVQLRYDAGTLTASGRASSPWIAEARQRVRFLSGVTAYDDANLEDEFGDLVALLERQALQFVGGRATLTTGQEIALDSLIAYVQRFQATVAGTGRRVRLQVLGHVSTEGNPAANRFLSQQRADAIQNVLIQRGMPPELVEAIGTGRPRFEGEEQSEAERAANRSVSFRVITVDEG